MRSYFAPMAICLAAISPSVAGGQTPAATTPWQLQTSATKASLRGIHAVGNGVAWASGTNGTILRTEDGGYMWQSCALPPGAEKLDFRGIWAWDANTAVAMSSGPGDLSRLYKTTDGCSSWKLLYTNPDKDGFWDAVQFWDDKNGLIFGDPVSRTAPPEIGGKTWKRFAVYVSADAGDNWKFGELESIGLNPGKGQLGAFAASNSSLAIVRQSAWYGVGGTEGSFVFPAIYGTGVIYKDGEFFVEAICNCLPPPKPTFEALPKVAVPLASGTESSGVFSLAFRDQNHGIAVGGDYKKPNESNGTAAYTTDGGKTWTAAAKPPHGYRSAVAWDAADKAHPGCWIAAGPNGSDISYDDGKTWQPLDNGNWNALSLPWVIGPEGRIAKLVLLKPAQVSQ